MLSHKETVRPKSTLVMASDRCTASLSPRLFLIAYSHVFGDIRSPYKGR